jgi:threonine dehydrogenase-like Zn-dependent dehydrogenase
VRAVYFNGLLQFDNTANIPPLNEDQSLIKVRLAGICNTDLELMRGYMGFSGILGHEFIGEVIEGDTSFKGKRVVGEINVACQKCDFCLRGIPSQCRNRTTVGINGHQGAFADYLCLATRNLHIVPDNVCDDQAVFVEPLAAALQILESVQISPRDQVILIGAGKLGMLIAQVIKLTGAKLTAIVRREKQTVLLQKWGIHTAFLGEIPLHSAQFVVDATGESSAFANALDLVEPRGTIVLKSTYQGIPQIDMTRIAVDEIRVVGSRCGPFDAALRLLQARLVEVESLIEARYSIEDALKAFKHAEQHGALKVLLEI